MAGDIFREQQAAAVLKHASLPNYLVVFTTKTGTTAGDVYYLDGYAAPGQYDDGTAGSPALALATAERVSTTRGKAQLHGRLVENEPDSCRKLRALLAPHLTWTVTEGTLMSQVDEVIASIPDSALTWPLPRCT